MIPIDLQGKVAIVTGSTQGLGLGIARKLAEAGCHVAGCGTSAADSEKVLSFKTVVKKSARESYYQVVDVKSERDINRFVENVIARFGKVDILISNAGKNMFTFPETCDLKLYEENDALNLRSHWLISKACYPELKRNKGSIVLITSNHAYATLPGCFPYNVAKAGIIGLVQALAIEWGPEIRVLALAPGFIETEAGESWFQSFPDPERKKQEIRNIHLVKKFGTVDEIGAFCAFLCSEYAGFVTGTTYLIDGGRSAVMQDI
ncbi:MAG: SDR family oxidoreductase [Prolixibacteraceae bacterium]|jgi:NAD(P)-dependent dehydrogenase (short-subunit alcohol dehydrogenase family)|nr:SDR family oxidoreductase [Prolixibacteraceae bacterium]